MANKPGRRLIRNTKTGAVYWFNEALVKDRDFMHFEFLTPEEEAQYLGVPVSKEAKKDIKKEIKKVINKDESTAETN